jgi:hypothetical protein
MVKIHAFEVARICNHKVFVSDKRKEKDAKKS